MTEMYQCVRDRTLILQAVVQTMRERRAMHEHVRAHQYTTEVGHASMRLECLEALRDATTQRERSAIGLRYRDLFAKRRNDDVPDKRVKGHDGVLVTGPIDLPVMGNEIFQQLNEGA